ncbi:hypothetical protein I317_01204 [Kwoniella heveanensis CBS 569]|nr:hypothetical protein I317_01204 [Kwoniella heveanensis CBS 569]
MSELPTDNVSDTQTQQQQRPDAVVLSNGTTLVASVDDKPQLRDQAGSDGSEEQPKGDLIKISSGDGQAIDRLPEDSNPSEILEDEGHIGSQTATEKNEGGSPDTQEAQEASGASEQDKQPSEPSHTSTESQAAPSITEPPLSEAQPSLASPVVRAVTPSSRTSTPPLGANALAKKKFSSVNVNQKFLSKAGSPAPAAGPTKISSLNASPVPIVSTSSRLLSTKLTTVPSNKSSASPHPPGSISASSSPWAKPVLPLPTAPIIEPEAPAPAPAPAATGPSAPSLNTTTASSTTTLHQPAPMRARVLGTTTTPPVMGAGLGISAPSSKPAWKAVSGEPRKPASGITRDFPTAMEVAEGKKAAQLAAQAQAAHNQAILQGLNAFTQLDPNTHRWDEEDEEDDVIDFGDGLGEPHHESGHDDGLTRDAPGHDQPVKKSDRFAEDFDRSWPRRPPTQQDIASRDLGGYPPRRQEGEGNRTLFNASSNRLEPRQPMPAPQVQPTRLMSRPTDAGGPTRQPPPHLSSGGRGGFERPLPPHLQGGTETGSEGSGRVLPPHMTGSGGMNQQQAAPAPVRSAWGGGMNRNLDRAPPPHLQSERHSLPSQPAVFEQQARSPEKNLSNLPSRRSFSHAGPPPSVPQHQSAPPDTEAPHRPHPPAVGPDEQAAEMHTAAEKARLRRLAEESEREAAAERARKKARELEERFSKTKVVTGSSEVKAENGPAHQAPPTPAVEPGRPTPQITLASRPKPAQAPAASSHLPPRPEFHDKSPQPPALPPSRSAESSWRTRMQSQPESVPEAPSSAANTSALSPPLDHSTRPARPTAESFFEATPDEATRLSVASPHDFGHPKKEANFDSMLARIQAAMAEARSAPEVEEVEELVGAHPVNQVDSAVSPEQLRIVPLAFAVQEYFDVTYPEPPKSPPPAWRSYHIRIPKAEPGRPSIPVPRLRAAEAPRLAVPAGFSSTFVAPTGAGIVPTLTRAEVLLPQPVLRRFQRFSEPVVSISPRQLEPFEKKPKKKAVAVSVGRSEDVPSAAPSETAALLAADPLKSQQLRDQRARADDWRQAESSTTVAEKPQPPPATVFTSRTAAPEPPVEAPPRKIKSPVKTSAAARAEREGRFATDGVTIGAPGGAFADKPGVRFMVSSELEGDSLLDEVNKMSLESVGEGDDKEQDAQSGESAKMSGVETPKTPPVPRPSSPNTSSWPKVPLSYPASHSPARSVSQQHDHDAIKSVWETQQTAHKQQNIESSNVNAPMYPSLNAPSSADPPAAQPLPSSMNMSFSNSQTFSSPGGSGPSLSAPNSYVNVHRAPSAPSPYGHYAATPQTIPSPDIQAHNMMGLSYSNMGNARASGTNGFQQGVWSPTAFGTSMASPGYSAYAAQQQQHQQQQQKTGIDLKSPATISYNGKVPEGMAYGGYQQASYPQQQQQQQQQYSATGYGRGVSNPANMYAYGYGAPGQQSRPASGRFAAQANGADYTTPAQGGYMGAEAGQGGYYGGVAQAQAAYPTANYQYQQQQQQQGHGAVGQSGRGGMGGARKMW